MDPADVVTVADADGGDVDAPPRLGSFELGRRLGEGGMGVVFEARDTLLDRRVALKLLRPGAGGEVARARLVREAQALARLSHPNVVTVYQVAISGDLVFAAMELIDGTDLRAWLTTRRPWREVVDVFLAAGRGLAAVHALGLVHRDFKPANVLIDGAGRVKVGDFGLVGLVERAAAGGDGGDAADTADTADTDGSEDGAAATAADRGDRAALPGGALTVTGSAMGTPAYMAPEQRRGGDVDARADQYSFAMSLAEALAGRRCVGPGDLADVPARLRPILARALAPDAADRYPAMGPLLDALARTRRPPTRWLVGGAAIALVAVATPLAWRATRTPAAAPPCPTPTARLAAMWGEARQRAVRDHLAAIDPAQGAARFAAMAQTVTPFVASWRDMQAASCRATRVDATQSDTLFDQRARCLDRRAAELDASVDVVVAAADAAALDAALVGLVELTPVDGCADAAALARDEPPGATPQARAAADAITARVLTIRIDLRADRLTGLAERAADVVAAARDLGQPAVLGAALAARARVELTVGDSAAAAATLRELTQVAARSHDDRREAFAWTKLIAVIGYEQGQPDDALALVPAASAAVLRAGDPLDARVDLLYAQGQILDEGARVADGLAMLEKARRALVEAGATRPGSPLAPRLADVLLELGTAASNDGDVDASVARYDEAIALARQLYGPDSSAEAIALHDLGETLRHAGRLDEALVATRGAARINEARGGDTVRLASNLVGVGTLLGAQGDWPGALVAHDRALQIYTARLGADDVELVPVLTGRASALAHVGRVDDALATYATLLALVERAGATTNNLPIALYNRGELYAGRDRCADALPDYTRAIERFEALDGATSPYLIYPLVGRGACLVRLRRPAEAIDGLERAVALEGRGGDALQIARGQAWLGRALVESRRDVRRGLALARTARAALAAAAGADPDGAAMVRELDRWLADR
ncbi:MAG: serine/threonine protein kinase [Kofleriaceae bacterium]|nr:serine/threonine protein kinase [Kofleriaceae bacterium]